MRVWPGCFCAIAALLLTGQGHAACPSPAADQTVAVPGHPFAAEATSDNCHLFASLSQGPASGAVAVLTNEKGSFGVTRSVRLPRGSGAGLALSHDGSMLAVSTGEALVLLDAEKLVTADEDPLIATVPEGSHGAVYTQFSKDDALLFVSEEDSASIAVLNVAALRQGQGSKAVVGRIATGQAPVGLALSPDGSRLFSTSQIAGISAECMPEQGGGRPHAKGALLSIDVAKAATDLRHAVVGMAKLGCNPVRVAVTADGHSLWVSERGDGRVLGIDPSSLASGGARVTRIEVGKSPVGLAIRPDGQQLWIADSDRFANGGGALALVTPAIAGEAKLASTIRVGAFPRDLRFLPDGKTLVAALYGEDAVLLHPTEP
ncbi:YncE family protein [Sphingomonas quercus]|uniref:YncE family protein n=1 Tax=Sphingomonas quercus TaxID=2842451 RepID=A0ABS6BMA4_9SPHN|nr:hypothetical protein [Sphingomonas quercus]MBU3078757.1 hypothetical protein [Sphingomonas quercus]